MPFKKYASGLLICVVFAINPTIGVWAQVYNHALTVKFSDEESLIDGKELNRLVATSQRKKPSEVSIRWERVFPPAGKFEEKHQAYGMHLWYRIYFDSLTLNPKALKSTLAQDERVEITELYRVKPTSVPKDSLFSKQWNFSNTGQRNGSPNHDVDFINASKIERGDPRVVVSIHDTGVDLHNPELTANLWTNEDEIPDNGIDDDNNGYIDDVHGYGFGEMNTKLNDTHGHGSHIAGVIAAKQDSRGVVGLAGGQTPDEGVRLMICRLDWDQDGLDIIRPEESMIYAADNGSVISQNSWNTYGFSYTVRLAIEYFAAEAKSEMLNGGIVVFAAGNSGMGTPRYEGEHPNVMMVASLDRNSAISYFSNFGTWIDVGAPGSDIFSNGTFGNYMYMSGTSMACPHVSGVAALVVSKYGHEQLSPNEVITKIKSSAVNIDEFNPYRHGMAGSGRVNAFRSLLDIDTIAPNSVENISLIPRAYDAIISWQTPYDNTIAPFRYIISLSTDSAISESNFSQNIVDTLKIINPEYLSTIKYSLEDLSPNTHYNLAIKALDYFNNESLVSENIAFISPSKPNLEISTYQEEHHFHVDSVYQKSIIIYNNGEGGLDWKISKTAASDSLPFRDLRVGHFSVFYQYTKVLEYVKANGGTAVRLPSDFYESDLEGVQVILIESSLHLADTSKVEIINRWVARGGNLILASNGIYNIDFLNMYMRAFGVSVKPYDGDYKREVTERFNANSPFAKNVYALELIYYDTYLDISNSNFEPLVHDLSNNVTVALGTFQKGKVFLATNNFWGSYFDDFSNNHQFAINTIDWLLDYNSIRLSEKSGTLESQASDTIWVNFNHNLGNDFSNYVYLTSNDADKPISILNYKIGISAYPILKQNKYSINFDTTFIMLGRSESLKIYNKGLSDLALFQISNPDSSFVIDQTNIYLPSGDSIIINVKFQPKNDGLFNSDWLLAGNTTDSLKLNLQGLALFPPLLKTSPEDTLYIYANGNTELHKTIYVQNQGNGIPLEGKVALRPVKLPDQAKAVINFKNKRIGISNMNTYFNAIYFLKLNENEVFDFKANLNNNPYPLDSIDIIILDYRIFNISNSDIDKIISWIRRGGNLIYQGDQYDNPAKINKLFSLTSTREIVYYSSFQTDTLKNINLHPTTEGLEYIYATQHYSYLLNSDLRKVIAYDGRNNPYVTYDYIGEGKVLFASDNIFAVPYYETDLRFLTQTLNWLASSERDAWINLSSRELSLKAGESASYHLSIYPDSLPSKWARLEFSTNDPFNLKKNIIVFYNQDGLPNSINHLPEAEASVKSVMENSANGLIIDTLVATDKDGDFLYFYTDNQQAGISIGLNSGIIFISDSSKIDYELQQEINYDIFVTDLKDTVKLNYHVLIQDVNEPPKISDLYFEMNEDDSSVFQLNFLDPENEETTIRLELLDEFLDITDFWSYQNDLGLLSFKPKSNKNGIVLFDVFFNDGTHEIKEQITIFIKPKEDFSWIEAPQNTILILDSLQVQTLRVFDVDNDTLMVTFQAQDPTLFQDIPAIEVINSADTVALMYYIKPIAKGETWVNIVVSSRFAGSGTSYFVQVQSLEQVMGIDQKNLNIKIYPNPNRGTFTIHSLDDPINSLKISDLAGRQLGFISTSFHSNQWQMQTNAPAGIYILNIETMKGQHLIRILIEE